MREYYFFQSNKLTAYKVRDRKAMAKSLMVFNLHKICPSTLKQEVFKDLVKLKLQPTRIFNWLLLGLNTNAFL